MTSRDTLLTRLLWGVLSSVVILLVASPRRKLVRLKAARDFEDSEGQRLSLIDDGGQAKADWKAARFATVPGDEAEFIPLPELPPPPVCYP